MIAGEQRLAGRVVSAGIYAFVSVAGLAIVLYPLWQPLVGRTGQSGPYGTAAPLVLALIVGLCFAALALEAASSGLGARTVAALGVLVAINTVLRFVEVAIPGPGGFSPVFFLIIVTGYAFGARFGLLMGALTMGVSAVLTGGVGPWLPYQMLVAGWVGLSAGWLPGSGARGVSGEDDGVTPPGRLSPRSPGEDDGVTPPGRLSPRSPGEDDGVTLRGRLSPRSPGGDEGAAEAGGVTRGEIAMLAAFGGIWGFLYGLLMTPWMWMMLDAGAGATGRPAVLRFLVYYTSTSLVWDGLRAVGTVVLVLVAGRPVLKALGRVAVRLDVRQAEGAVGTGLGAGPGRSKAAPPETSSAPGPTTAAPLGARAEARPTTAAPLPAPAEAARVPATRHLEPADEIPASHSAGQGVAQSTLPAAPQADVAVHPYAWVAWAAAAAALASLTRNPMLLALTGLAVLVVRASLPRRPHRDDAVPLARLAIVILVFSALYHLLSVHIGASVLLRLPARWPLIGGPLTLEALALGVVTGLSLVTLLLAFATLHRALSMRSLVRLVPRAFGSLALVGAVALTFVPSVRAQAAAIRDAQAVRGHRGSGPRTWMPLALPLLVGALERSAQLAESMASRGLVSSSGSPVRGRLAFTSGLAVVLLGWLGAVTNLVDARLAGALVIGGVLLAGGVLVWLGRRIPHCDYRHAPTGPTDVAVAALAWLPLVLAAAYPAAAESLAFSPMPALARPPLDAWLALSVAGLAAPAVFVTRALAASGATRSRSTMGASEPAPAKAIPASRSLTPANVTFRGYGVRYPHAAQPALLDIDLDLPHGQLTLLAGPSGSGKSTLLRSVNGLVPHFTGGEVWGDVTVGGQRPPDLGGIQAAPSIGFVPGDPETAFVMDVVADEVAFALEHRAVPRHEMERRVRSALERVGLAGLEDRPIQSLSGGERQRVAVASALAVEPRVLLLDEPTSQLDDDSAAEVLGAVADIASQLDLTVVLAEHRLDRVLPVADLLVYLPQAGAQPVAGPPSEVLAGLTLPEAPSPPPLEPGEPVLELRDLCFAFQGQPVLTGATLKVRSREIVALTGRSGSGKTTLLRLATGLLQPEGGQVRVEGRSVAGLPVADICQSIGYLPQDPSSLLYADSVADELRITLANYGRLEENSGHVVRLLTELGIADLADRYPRDLSTGQRQRVALAAVAVADPPLLLLDEPTRGMDDAAIAGLAGILHERALAGCGVLVATHDRRLTRAAHRHLRLAGGRVIQETPS